MKALRLAIYLIRIPRLFASLVLFPFVLSLILVYVQLLVTGVWIKSATNRTEDVEATLKHLKESSIGRRLIYGHGEALPPLKLCRWQIIRNEAGEQGEMPPSPECAPDRLDVALKVSNPKNFDAKEYQRIFEGNIERLHVCQTCQPDVVIAIENKQTRTEVYSIWGLIVLNLVRFSDSVSGQYIKAFKSLENVKDLIGNVSLHSRGFREPISITGFYVSMAIVFNIAFLVVVTMWLALKAHRKVLDYFARSGALLPMVAATGKSSFYGAIWCLTSIRVFAFLFAGIPATYFGFRELLKREQVTGFFGQDPFAIILWLITMISSIGLATLIASIADLKQRHTMLGFVYRYLPISVCVLGMFVWSVTLLVDTPGSTALRMFITGLPIFGMAPILIAPVFPPDFNIFIVHALLTALAFLFALKRNSRWFAAHLEEL